MEATSILHCDMNAYYASVEMTLNPALRGKAVVVGGSREDRHGIVLAKSQKAKEKGVKTGEILSVALGKCPELIIVPPHYDAYIYYSTKARDIYYRYTDQVESFGLDECWLDVAGSAKLFGSGPEIADLLREQMKRELGLTISVGVSFNKVFAKLGSDLKKPDATTVISREDVPRIVWQQPVRSLLGVGRATERKLHDRGIRSIGDLAQANPRLLQDSLGINGYRLWRWANGWDDGRVRRFGEAAPVKTVGHGLTLRNDIYTKKELKSVFIDLSRELARRLRIEQVKAGGIQIYLKTKTFAYREFQTALPYPSRSSRYLAEAAYTLACQNMQFKEAFRAVGIRAIRLLPEDQPLQLNFFSDAVNLEKLENISDAFHDLEQRFGKNIVAWGIPGAAVKTATATPWEICPPGLPI